MAAKQIQFMIVDVKYKLKVNPFASGNQISETLKGFIEDWVKENKENMMLEDFQCQISFKEFMKKKIVMKKLKKRK